MKNKIITICGSSRYIDVMAVVAWLLEKNENAIVLSLHFLPEWYVKGIKDHLAEHEGVSDQMDKLHLKKIDMSDEIFVVNCEHYVGKSTTNEVNYAIQKNKHVRWYTDDKIGNEVDNIIIDYHSSLIPKNGKN